jgi:hypothetical protein
MRGRQDALPGGQSSRLATNASHVGLTLRYFWQRPFSATPPKGFSSPERLLSLCGGCAEGLACGGKGVNSSYSIAPRTQLLVFARLLSEATWFLSTGGLTTRHWCQWVRR